MRDRFTRISLFGLMAGVCVACGGSLVPEGPADGGWASNASDAAAEDAGRDGGQATQATDGSVPPTSEGGGSLCEQLGSGTAHTRQTGGPCADASGVVAHRDDAGVTTSVTLDSEPFDVARCEAAVASCTDHDRNVLTLTSSCLHQLAACTPGGERAWLDAYWQCVAGVLGLSPSCAAALE